MEVLEEAIVNEMLTLQDNFRKRAVSNPCIKKCLMGIQERVNSVGSFCCEEDQLRNEDLAVIEGQKSLEATGKKKLIDTIWQIFYGKAKDLKD